MEDEINSSLISKLDFQCFIFLITRIKQIMICSVILLFSTKENAYYSSPSGHPAGIVQDAVRFHGLGAILD